MGRFFSYSAASYATIILFHGDGLMIGYRAMEVVIVYTPYSGLGSVGYGHSAIKSVGNAELISWSLITKVPDCMGEICATRI